MQQILEKTVCDESVYRYVFHLPTKFVARQLNLAINGRPKITNKLLAIEGWKENSSRRKRLVYK